MAVTISDVARAAGVSKGSVSFALNGRPGVSDATRAHILRVADGLGWSPNLRARSLSSATAYAIGVVIPRPAGLLGSDPFFPAFLGGVETVLSTHDYALVLHFAPDLVTEEHTYRKLAAEGRVDGVILTDLRAHDGRIALIEQLGMPAVTLNQPAETSPFPAVCIDDAQAISAVVEHLVHLGHRRIAHVGGPQSLLHGQGRRRAWQATLESFGLPARRFVETDFGAAAGIAATDRLLTAPDGPPSAIVYANDIMAIASQAHLQARGIQVPAELSMTGFDDSDLARFSHPPLTTVATDAAGWGRAAADVLLARIRTGAADDLRLLPPRLVIRSSTGPAPAATTTESTTKKKGQV